jgi:hypothetical protein
MRPSYCRMITFVAAINFADISQYNGSIVFSVRAGASRVS